MRGKLNAGIPHFHIARKHLFCYGIYMLFIFDVGGVVTNSAAIYPLVAAKFNISVPEFAFYCGGYGETAPQGFPKGKSFTPDIALELTKGNITIDDFWRIFTERSHLVPKENYWATLFKPVRNEKTYEIIAKLKKHNRVISGTNTIQDHYDIHMANHDYDIFDKCYASQLMHEAKPELSFWTYILKAEHVEAKDAYFIDDTQANIDAAASLGLNVHHFIGADDLELAVKNYF